MIELTNAEMLVVQQIRMLTHHQKRQLSKAEARLGDRFYNYDLGDLLNQAGFPFIGLTVRREEVLCCVVWDAETQRYCAEPLVFHALIAWRNLNAQERVSLAHRVRRLREQSSPDGLLSS